MALIKVRAGFQKQGNMSQRADRIGTIANTQGLGEMILGKAHNVAESARATAMAAARGARSRSESQLLTAYADSITVVDGGRDFRRRAFPSASTIRVALVTTEGAAAYALAAEYGSRGVPGSFALTGAVLDNGGTTL